MSVVERVHGEFVFGRRIRVLASHLAPMLPQGARVLDVGCGDGSLASLIMAKRPDVSLEGVDVLVRPHTSIPVRQFDGVRLPYDDASVDVAMFVDVLHHTADPMVMLREAARVARRGILIKDHLHHGLLAGLTLRFMDWVGNARHGVSLPYNYWRPSQWGDAFAALRMLPTKRVDRLGLYPPPASWLFDRALHFVALLEPSRARTEDGAGTGRPASAAAVRS